ncbi:MAG: Rossmann-like and DUF2520 domain-containing protein [Candidatus Ornithomonoglobus sp.]
MKIGFIGAGKCGMSLAAYFAGNGIEVCGFSSRHKEENSGFDFYSAEELVKRSGIIFMTVTDAAISEVWQKIKRLDLENKIICHCSGSLTSEAFDGAKHENVCSIHPMLAFNSRSTSSDAIKKAFFTLEGGANAISVISKLLDKTGNKYKIIDKSCKAEYHAAACFASNFVVAVCERAEQHLESCGFSREEAHEALIPLMRNNMDNIIACGTRGAITGPAARGDMMTIEKHLGVMGADTELYKLLTDVIFEMKEI